jgi:membrane protein DedA with SNARE-associated domain
MEQIEIVIRYLQDLPPLGVLGMIFLVAYIENVFPPSPSDVLLVFAGTLVGVGVVGFVPALVSSTLGGTLGFMTAYAAGRYFDGRIAASRMSRFLPLGAVEQVEHLFKRYGYGVIVANRFLAGTRAVVSFFAGMARMNLAATTVLSAVSAAVWNTILLYAGVALADNWRRAVEYLSIYSKVVTVLVVAAVLLVGWRYWRRRRREKAESAE